MKKEAQETQAVTPDVQADTQETEGIYANMAVIAHSSSEFVVDFLGMLPGMSRAQVKKRIVMPPLSLKFLLMQLQENVGQYERAYGEIRLHDQPAMGPDSSSGFKA